jgi:hypothetical protein
VEAAGIIERLGFPHPKPLPEEREEDGAGIPTVAEMIKTRRSGDP